MALLYILHMNLACFSTVLTGWNLTPTLQKWEFRPYCCYRLWITKKDGVEVASSNQIFIPDFSKIGQLLQKFKW